MVDSLTVSIATGMPAAIAVRSSPSSSWVARPFLRWVGATVIVLIAQAGMLARPGSVRSAGQALAVATGTEGSAAVSS